jgi:hypothetical protein
MTDSREVRAYAYVNCSYDLVVELLRLDAVGVFQRATATAAERAQSLLSTMRATIGPFELGTEVVVRVRGIEESSGPLGPTTRLSLTWHAAQRTELFPTMEATLAVYALGPGETQLDFSGKYRPPLGVVGAAFDAMLGHRIAEATVHRFLEEVSQRVRMDVVKTAS